MSQDQLKDLTEAQILKCLSPPVERHVIALNTQGVPWDQIGHLLALTPSAALSLKGPGWNRHLWLEVKAEVYSFLCEDSEPYSDLRSEWNTLTEKSSALAIASLSGAIGSELGMAGGVVAPMVIWAIAVAVRIGKEAACRAFRPPAVESPQGSPTA